MLAVIVPLSINSNRIDKTTIRESDVRAVAEHCANDAGWAVVGVTATGYRVLVEATGPNPAPGLAALRRDLDAAGLNGLSTCGSTWSQPAKSACQSKTAAAGFTGGTGVTSRHDRAGPCGVAAGPVAAQVLAR